MTDSAALIAEARTHLGGPPGPLRVGRDPVNLPMVHHWCQALDDQNPAYLDEDFAASTRGHLIAGEWCSRGPHHVVDLAAGRLDQQLNQIPLGLVAAHC